MADPKPFEQFYQIGTVAKLTGLSTHNIRMWERRYGLVAPDRSQSRNRLYSQHDLERLKLIKQLVDCGHTVSQVAHLDKVGLQQLLSQQSTWSRPAASTESFYTQVFVISDYLNAGDIEYIDHRSAQKVSLLTHSEATNYLDPLTSASHRIEDFSASILLIDQPTLHPDDAMKWLQRIRWCQCSLAIIVYQYSDQDTLKAFTSRVSKSIKGPMTPDLLERELLVIDSSSPPPPLMQAFDNAPQRFSYHQLIRFAQMSTANHCECPKHLATLLLDLVNFEQYSKECENRNMEDKAMHEYLYMLAGSVRTQLEEALVKLAEMEQIPIES